MYLCLAALGLCFCEGFSSCGACGLLLPHRGFSLLCAGLVALWHVQSWFPNQGSNPRPLHGKAGSQPLDHQGGPGTAILLRKGRKKRRGRQEATLEHAPSFFVSFFVPLPCQPLCKDNGKAMRRYSEKTAIYKPSTGETSYRKATLLTS